jgi:hypothetical protein
MSLSTATTPIALTLARDTVAADLGTYYTSSTVPGTGLIGHAVSTTLVETKAIFSVYNGGALTIYPQYLRLTMTVLPVGNTQQQFTVVEDQGNRFSAFVAGNALTPVNQNMNSTATSAAQVSAGAVTLTANTPNRRIVGHRQFRPTVIGVVGDVYQFSWGSGECVDPSGLPTDGTLRAHIYYNSSPLVLPPGSMMAIHAWGATFSTGATYEFEFAHIEK